MEKERLSDLITSWDYQFEDLPQSEFYHFLLKCTDGLFKGKFFYINTSTEGEIIGGGDYNNLTLHIEKANLSDKHCSIKFTPQFKYILNDLSSADGTWVKIFDCNLTVESRDRIYRVSEYEFVFLNLSPEDVTSKKYKSNSEDAKYEGMKPLKMILRKRNDKTNQKIIELIGDKI